MRPSPLHPPKINPHCLDQWFAACKNLPDDDRLAWRTAMHNYVHNCDTADLSPFLVSNPDNAIRDYLGKRRRMFVRYLDYTGLMKDIPIRKVNRKVTIDNEGFSINVEAWIKVQDPTWFRKPKTKWRFTTGWDKEHRFKNQVDPGMFIYVKNAGIRLPGFWYFGYTVTCPINPDYHDSVEIEDYILKHLWDSATAEWRAKGLNRVKHI